jgi:hypothetical protein
VPAATSPVPSRQGLLNAYRAAVHVLALFVLVQAVIAGRWEGFGYGDWSIVPHGILGNVSFLLGVTALVLAIVVRAPNSVVVVAAVLAALLAVQITLGYSAATSGEAGSWHIVNGVVIFGLSVYQIAAARRVSLTSGP